MFKPPQKKQVFSDDFDVVDKRFKILRNQVFIFSIITYIMYYFTRKSVDLSGNFLMEQNVLTKENFALLGMFFAITYGLSKFIIGNFADRSSGRVVMVTGLISSALINILLGGIIQVANVSITIGPLVMMIVLLVMLGIVQGMGWPSTARIFAHWFTDKERSARIGIWNCGHGLGSAFLPLIIIPLVDVLDPEQKIYGLYYWIPSLFALFIVPFAIWGLRDRPESEGLPTIEKWKGLKENEKEKNELSWKVIFVKYIIRNKYIWILAFANIWVYVLRQGISTWSLKIVHDTHDINLKSSKILWSFFEWAGIVGGIFAAYMSRWLFQNRKSPLMIIGLALTIIGIIIFQTAPYKSMTALSIALIISGFGIYMPQAMIGATSIELTNKKAAATASGFTGLFGYFGDAIMSKPIVALIAKDNNWDGVFYYFYTAAVLAIIALAFLWNKNEKDKLI